MVEQVVIDDDPCLHPSARAMSRSDTEPPPMLRLPGSEILTRPRPRLASADPSMKPSPGEYGWGQAAAEGGTQQRRGKATQPSCSLAIESMAIAQWMVNEAKGKPLKGKDGGEQKSQRNGWRPPAGLGHFGFTHSRCRLTLC